MPIELASRPRSGSASISCTTAASLTRIVAAIAPRRGDLMVEIGPGPGALTRRCSKRCDTLHVSSSTATWPPASRAIPAKAHVHQADALEFDFARFPRRLRVVGNLPYNISTPLLFHLARFAARVRDMHFMLQHEVVERMVAAPSTPATAACR